LEPSSARGKWLVAIILGGSLLFLAFALWYFFTQSPPDQRFNMARAQIPAQTGVADLLPPELDEFKRDAAPTTGEGSSGLYVNTNDSSHRVTFAVRQIASADSGGNVSDTLRTALCSDGSGTPALHPDAAVPFGYATCAPTGPDTGANFVWINGRWLFSATSADPEVLILFVNVYPY
jgi:hypothetical protein